MNKLIQFKNIVKEFDGQIVLKGINLDIYENEFVTLLGPSGCGKTTLLRILGGFLRQNEGQVIFDNEDITDVPPYKRELNTVFQKYALFPHMNVYDNIAFGLKIKKEPKDVIEQKVNRMLKLVGLEDYGKRAVTEMSGGQQQRVAIARALVNEPKVLLLDEPLGALDLKLRKEMQHELKKIQQEVGITFIYVTHDQEEALTMSDKIVVMKDGEIQQIGTPTDIYNEPVNEYVANFIGESNIIDGVMIKDYEVMFEDKKFECVDFGFDENEPVQVVIRPEDIDIVKRNEGKLRGVVRSVLFKGVHYEITVEVGRFEIVIQSTGYAAPGALIGMRIEPDGIHIMEKVYTENKYDGVITKNNTVKFGDGEFECDVTTLYPGSHLDEEGYLITAAGEKLDLTGTEVTVEIGFTDITMSDEKDAGGVEGNIISMIYKGDHYRYIVRTEENEEDYVLACPDLWNTGDKVSLIIPADKIKLTLKPAAGEKK